MARHPLFDSAGKINRSSNGVIAEPIINPRTRCDDGASDSEHDPTCFCVLDSLSRHSSFIVPRQN